MDSFAPRLSKLGQADILTFKDELARYFDESLFLNDQDKEHKIVYRDIEAENIVQIEIYVDKENLEISYGKIIEKQIDKMSKIDIENLVFVCF